METVEEPVKRVVERLDAEFREFINCEVASPAYAAKGAAIEELVLCLARKHPRWSAEQEIILPWSEENSHLTKADENTPFWVFEYVEELVWSWREMEADHPTAVSLAHGLSRFPRALLALCRVAENMVAL